MADSRTTASLIDRLWGSDAANALTNEAAREIERLRRRIDLADTYLAGLGQLENFEETIGGLNGEV